MDKRIDKAFEVELEQLLQTLHPASTAVEVETLKKALQQQITYLVNNDFERLVRLLYTMDVDERELKHLLQQQPQPDAAVVITDLLLERQIKKVETRAQFKNSTPASGEEAW